MGLDIYLETRDHKASSDAHEAAIVAWWETAKDLSDEERRISREAANLPPHTSHENVPSESYPDHLFNRRYLRSSYNGGGFNHAVPEMLAGADGLYPEDYGSLYWIFLPMGREWDGDEGELTPEDIDKLRACRSRALEVADGLRKCDRLRVMTIDHNLFGGPSMRSDNDALKSYRDHIKGRDGKLDGWYVTDRGNLNVFGDGLTIIAAVPGVSALKTPAVHLIYRAGDEGFDSYIQSAEIVAEFCDEAIGLIERDGSCYLSWSG